MTLDVFLLILRILLIVLLYLFLMQVVIAISRDLRRSAVAPESNTANAAPIPGHLVVVDSGPSHIAPGTIFPLKLKSTIGRGPSNTVQIAESFISGEHARMWYHNGSWFVQDAGSTNGTYLNNQPAREALPAHFGDMVQIGFIKFLLKQ
ncbi:MAG TPA: FHA domain-containing protein [Ktedonobacteraceae bacterium]|nr:FHA domain-containing protein [Ktedonobacteraceae bacterium]